MQLSVGEKRCLQIFKTFVQKAFVPQIKQANGSFAEWNIFQSLLSAPNISINELQFFVDSLSANSGSKVEKMTLSKKQQQIQQITKQLNNLNKTFGGQKYRNSLVNLAQDSNVANRRQSTRDEPNKLLKSESNSGIMAGLQRLLRGMQSNQRTIESLQPDQQNSSMKNNRQVFNQLSYNSPMNGSSGSSYSYQPSYQSPVIQAINPSFYKQNY